MWKFGFITVVTAIVGGLGWHFFEKKFLRKADEAEAKKLKAAEDAAPQAIVGQPFYAPPPPPPMIIQMPMPYAVPQSMPAPQMQPMVNPVPQMQPIVNPAPAPVVAEREFDVDAFIDDEDYDVDDDVAYDA